MNELKFGMMYDRDIVRHIREITGESSALKKEIFKTTVMKKSLDKKICIDFLTAVNDFLRYWDEYSQDLRSKLKSTTGVEGIRTIDYQYVKEFIYAKYDYASVLPFADGIIKGVNSEKFTSTDDIEDFRDHMISKAFDNQSESSAELLDSVLVNGNGIGSINGIKPISATDAKLFNSVRNYDMFDRRSRPELYNSITEIIKFMTFDIGIGKYINTTDIKMFVSIINNIVDYITYSLTAYATRIYIISAYAYPFILNNKELLSSPKTTMYENASSDVDMGANETRVFIDADEMICRDPAKTKELFGYFDQFLKMIGADSLFGTDKQTYQSHWKSKETVDSTAFCSKLASNPLHELLTGDPHGVIGYRDDSDAGVLEFNQMLKEYIYNSNQGIQGESSPKQEILHVIRGTTGDGTLKGYQNLAKDLYLCAIHLCCGTETLIKNIIGWKYNENQEPRYNTGILNAAAESLKILSEFYRDISSAIVQKARDIELNVNVLRSGEINKAISGMSIQIPNQKSDVDGNANMMTSVPDTTRMPTELMDIYNIPTLECMEMYNEYIRSIPGMEDDIFFSEAFNLAAIFDAIITSIQNALKRFDAFWRNKDVQLSIKWITDHENELVAMDFSAGSMKVHRYKTEISLPKNFKNISIGLGNFNLEKIKTKEDSDKFIQSLYPSPVVYGWFTDTENQDGKTGPIKYRNYILFYDEATTKKEIPEDVAINGAQIQKYVGDWIKTVKDLKTTRDQLTQIGTSIEEEIKKIKLKFIEFTAPTNKAGNNPSSTATNPPTAQPTGNKPGASGEQSQDAPPVPDAAPNLGEKKPDSNVGIASAALNDIQLTVNRVSNSLSPIFIEYIKTMYNYLKEAYSIGRKK